MSEQIQAWETEDAVATVWGTHDRQKAVGAWEGFLRECGFKPGDYEWIQGDDLAVMWSGARECWGDPAGNWFDEDDRPWDAAWVSNEEREGWVPYLVVYQ